MSDEPNYFLQAVAVSREERIAADELTWEQNTCKYMLTKLQLGGYRRLFRQTVAASRSGKETDFRLTDFYNVFPTFPFTFWASRLRRVPILEVEALTATDYHVSRCRLSREKAKFTDFNKVPFVKMFYDFCEHSEEARVRGKHRGLIFPHAGFTRGMVIHDDETESAWGSGSAWVFKGTPAHPTRLFVQPFKDLLAGIHAGGRGWKPD